MPRKARKAYDLTKTAMNPRACCGHCRHTSDGDPPAITGEWGGKTRCCRCGIELPLQEV